IRLDQRHARSCAGSGSAMSDGYVLDAVGSGDAEWLGSLPPALVVPHAVEAGPEHVHGCADDLLAGHVWVLVPPEREPGETGANDFRGHLECFLVGGAREVLRARLAGEDAAERDPRLGLDLAVRRLGAGIAGRLAEQVLAPRLQQLVARTLEQTPVQVDLRREVVVQDRRRHAGPRRDLVDRRAAVTALGEHLGRRLLDDLAAGLGGQAPARARVCFGTPA